MNAYDTAYDQAIAAGADHAEASAQARAALRATNATPVEQRVGKCSTHEHGHRNHERTAECSGFRTVAAERAAIARA